MNNEYVTGLHKYLQGQYGSEFKLNEQQFQEKLNNDPKYVNGLYTYLQGQYGSEFTLSPEEFSGKVKKKDQSQNGYGQTQPGSGSKPSQAGKTWQLPGTISRGAGLNQLEEEDKALNVLSKKPTLKFVEDKDLKAEIRSNPKAWTEKVIEKNPSLRDQTIDGVLPGLMDEDPTIESEARRNFRNATKLEQYIQSYDQDFDNLEKESDAFTGIDIKNNPKKYKEAVLNDYLQYLKLKNGEDGQAYLDVKERVDYYKSLGDKLYNDEAYADDLNRYQDLQKEALNKISNNSYAKSITIENNYDWNYFSKKASDLDTRARLIEKQMNELGVQDGKVLSAPQRQKYDELTSQYNQIQSEFSKLSQETNIDDSVIDQMRNVQQQMNNVKSSIESIDNEEGVNAESIRKYKAEQAANKKAQEEFYNTKADGNVEAFGKGVAMLGQQAAKTFVEGIFDIARMPEIAGEAFGAKGYGWSDKLSETADNINSMVELYNPQLETGDFSNFMKFMNTSGQGLGSVAQFITAGSGASRLAKGLRLSEKGLNTANKTAQFVAAASTSTAQLYNDLIDAGFKPEDAARYSLGGGVVMGAAEMLVSDDELIKNEIKQTFVSALKSGSTTKEAIQNGLSHIGLRSAQIAGGVGKETFEEGVGSLAESFSKEVASTMTGNKIDGIWNLDNFNADAIAGGGGTAFIIEMMKFGPRKGRNSNPFEENLVGYLAENYDKMVDVLSKTHPEDYDKIADRFKKLKDIHDGLKNTPAFNKLSKSDQDHILAQAHAKQVVLDNIKQSGLDKAAFADEIASIDEDIFQTLNGLRSKDTWVDKSKTKENAVQEPGTEEVLPRQQGEVTETGGQLEGVGPSIQGEVAPEEEQGQEVQLQEEVGDVIAEINAPSTLAASVYPVIGEIETAIENNEAVNEDKLVDAENKLYSLLDEIDSRQDLTEDQKARMSEVIENRITKLQNYDNRTRTETSTTTQAVAARRVEKAQGKNERAAIPVRTVAEEGIDVTYDGRAGRVELRDGQYVFVPKKLGAVQARPIVIGEAAQVNANSTFAGVENPTSGPNAVVANITLPNGSTLSVLNDDLSVDIGLEIAKQEVGAAPQALFDVVFDEVVSEQKREVPVQKKEEEQAPVQVEEQVQEAPVAEQQAPAVESGKAPYTGVTKEDRALKEKVKDDFRKRRILDQAQRIAMALGNSTPIFIHETTDDYNSALSERGLDMSKDSSNGKFVYAADGSVSEIHIDLSKANERTIPHEAVHAVLFKAFGDNQALFQDFKNRLKPLLEKSTVKQLEDFANSPAYVTEGVTAEEFLAELGGVMTAQDNRIPKTTLQKIAKLINEFVDKITKGKLKVFEDTARTSDVIDFFNSMADAFAKGKLFEMSLDKFSEISTPGSEIDGNVIRNKQSISDSVISDFDTSPIQDKNNPVNLIYPDKTSIEDVLNQSGGAAVFINSDGTKVGKSIINGKELILQGGVDYTFIDTNVNDNIGFAASEDEKIKTLQTMAQEVVNLRDEKNPEHKGKPVAVFVVVQNGETMLGEWYAAEFIMEGLDKAITSKKYPGGTRKAKSDFLKAIEAVKTNTKTVSGKQDEKSKNKLINYIKSNKFDTHEGRLDIAKFLSSKEFSFGFRVNLNGELIPSNEKSWNSGKNRDFKQAMAFSNHTMNEFYNNFLDNRLLKIVNGTKLASEKGKSIANRTFSGFFYNPSDSLDSQIKHARLGVEHNQFNSSFKSEGNFLLENAHNVNSLNPDMGYPTKDGYSIYNKNNGTSYSKKNAGLKEKNIISTWLNQNNYSNLVVNPYSSIALSIYTGYVEESINNKSKSQKSSLKSKSQLIKQADDVLASRKIEGKFLTDQESIDLQKEIESNYSNASDIFNKQKDDIRMNLYNYENPYAETTINGVNLRIAQGLREKNGDNVRSTYYLYADGKIAGKFYSVQDIKDVIKFIKSNLIPSNLLEQETKPTLESKSQLNEITLKDGSVVTPTEIDGQTTFYHASDKKREGRLRPNTAPQWGKAVYFATNKDSATSEFGKDNTTEVNLNLKNPVYTNSEEFKNLELKATELYNKDMLPKILEDETYYVNGKRVFSDEDIQLEYEKNGYIDRYSASDIEDGKYFGQAAKELGYDAIVDVSNSQYGTEIAVIDESTIIYPEDIKSKSQETTIPKAKSQESSMVFEINQAMNKTGLAKDNSVKRFIEKYGQNGLVAKQIIDNFDKIQEQLGITKICNI